MSHTEQSAALGEFQGYVDSEPSIKWYDRARMPQVGDQIFAVSTPANASASSLTSYGLPARIDGVDLDQLLRTAVINRDEVLALHRQLAGEKLRADQGWARAEAKSRECNELRERMAAGGGEMHANLLTSTTLPAGSTITARMDLMAHGIAGMIKALGLGQGRAETAGDAGEAPTCRSSDDVQVVQEQRAAALAPQPGQSEAGAALRVAQDQEILSTLLWLYRRLPPCYGRPPHVEGPIKALARRVGADVADCLAERGPDPVEGNRHGQ